MSLANRLGRSARTACATVLADMLNFHISTFETYANLAAGNRGEYPTLRPHASPSHRD